MEVDHHPWPHRLPSGQNLAGAAVPRIAAVPSGPVEPVEHRVWQAWSAFTMAATKEATGGEWDQT